jgi:phage tail-like protein
MKRSEIEHLLPDVFQRTVVEGSPIAAVLDAMADLITPCEDTLEQLDGFFDPYRAPDRFVPMLASWVDLDRFLADSPEEFGTAAIPRFPAGLGSLRELVANAAYLSKWRGTAAGLVKFLETATGLEGFSVDEHPLTDDGSPRPFHVVVNASANARTYERLINRIVDMEKPAYVTYEVSFG